MNDLPSCSIADRFATDGFVAIAPFLTGDELGDLRRNVERFLRDVVPNMLAEHVFYEQKDDQATLKQLQRLGDYDPWFETLFTTGQFRRVAEQLLDGPVVPKNMQYFNKPPGIGQPTPPHQDGYYFMLEPCEAVTMWLALDDVDETNGCVRYVRGSHRRGMRHHSRTTTLGFSQGIDDYPNQQDELDEVALPAAAGDLLVHHALTIHRADANRDQHRSRRAIGLIYYSHRAREDQAAHAAYQRKLAAEMRDAGRI